MKKAVLILLTFVSIFMVGCAQDVDIEESHKAVEKEHAESEAVDLPETSQESEVAERDESTSDKGAELDKNPNAGEAYGGTLDISEEELKATIISQIADMNQYIDDHCGWPEDEYDPGAYIGSNTYIDELILLASTDTFLFGDPSQPDLQLGTIPYEDLARLKWAMFDRRQFFLGMHDDYPQYNDILTHWLEQGHFAIETIDTISVEYVTDVMKFDTHHCNIIVTFTSNGETYICWMEGITASAEGAGYKILDVQRQ